MNPTDQTEMKTPKLSPCPFCGGAAFSHGNTCSVPGMEDCGYWATGCHSCEIEIHADSMEEAEDKWERRMSADVWAEVETVKAELATATAKLSEAERQGAEMRAVFGAHLKGQPCGCHLCEETKRVLASTTIGKGYRSPEEWAEMGAEVEKLRFIVKCREEAGAGHPNMCCGQCSSAIMEAQARTAELEREVGRLKGDLATDQDFITTLRCEKDEANEERDTALERLKVLEGALHFVRKIICEGAMTGFNCHSGTWATELYASQGVTHRAIAGSSEGSGEPEVDRA